MFKTQYDARDRVLTNPGSPVKKSYGGIYNERGQLQLVEKGEEDLYGYIQSFAESVDINVILARFTNGESDALSKVQGFYGDITGMPTTYADALNRIDDCREMFQSLPLDVRAKFNHSFTEFLASSQADDFLEKLGIRSDLVHDTVSPDVEKPEAVVKVEEAAKEVTA
jgi:hypothetical protein